MHKVDIWKPSLIAGAIFGFLSGVPIVGAINCLCCMLIVVAGVLAGYMAIKGSSDPVSYGTASHVGLLTGVFAGIVCDVTSFLFEIAMKQSFADRLQQSMDQVSQMMPGAEDAVRILNGIPSLALQMIFGLILIVLYAPFGTLGGIIGRALFEKRVAPPPAAPPGVAPGSSQP